MKKNKAKTKKKLFLKHGYTKRFRFYHLSSFIFLLSSGQAVRSWFIVYLLVLRYVWWECFLFLVLGFFPSLAIYRWHRAPPVSRHVSTDLKFKSLKMQRWKLLFLSEPGFDPGTCGLWAHHASAAPLWYVDSGIQNS